MINNVDVGLLRFCLEHSDFDESKAQPSNIPKRDPKDYEFLKAAMNSLKSDVDMMKELIANLQTETSIEKKASLLEELHYFIEDLDNANDFHKIGGMEVVLAELSSPSAEVRKFAAWILTSIPQNNPKGQQTLLQYNVFPIVLNHLRTETQTEVQNKYLSLISAMIRDNNAGKNVFLENDGFNLLKALLTAPGTETSTKMRVVLILKHFAMESFQSIPTVQEFVDILIPLYHSQDSDLREKVVGCLLTFLSCDNTLQLLPYYRAKNLPVLLQQRLAEIESSREEHLTEFDTSSLLLKELHNNTTSSKPTILQLVC